MRLIDADALKNAFSNMYREDYERWIKEVIDNAPTIEPFVKIGAICNENCGGYRPKGKWIEGENGNIKCNRCGCEIRYSYLIGNKSDFPKFCCDCGADMRGDI